MLDMPNQEVVWNIPASYFIAGIVKIPTETEKALPYADLPRTENDKKKICELVSSLGKYSYFELLKNEKHIRKIGDDLRYLHPFKFLGYIFSKPELKDSMKNVMKDVLIRKSFIEDLSNTCDNYYIKKQLDIYIDDFASELNIPAEPLKPFILKKDWSGMLKFITFY
jgi:hypothetical protein